MRVSARVILALVLGLSTCVGTSLGADESRPAFEALCSLIRLTETDVTLPAGVALPNDLQDDLIKLNMTTAEDNWYDLFSGNPEDTWSKVKDKDPFKAWATQDRTIEEMYTDWNQAKKELLEDAKEKKDFLRPPAGHQRKIAHFRIRRLWQRLLDTRVKQDNLVREMNQIATEVEKKFRAARTGKADRPEVTQASFDQGNRGSNGACGGTGAAKTGPSLANDIVCVCTGTSGHGNQQCATGLNSNVQNVAWSTADATLVTAYTTINKTCPAAPNEFKVTPQAVRSRIAKFWSLLGKNVAASGAGGSANSYTLGGTAVTGGTCDGGAVASMCVNYKANLHGAASGSIPWLDELETAATKLEEFDAKEKQIHALIARAESLRDAAWTAYEEARLPDPTGATESANEPATKADKPTTTIPGVDGKAEEKSATTIPRFILPWTFLV